MALGEEWCFTQYRSANEIHIGTERVVRDILLLARPSPSPSPPPPRTTSTTTSTPTTSTTSTLPSTSPSPPPPQAQPTQPARTLRRRTLPDMLAPYACYATLLLAGPATTALAAHFARLYDSAPPQMQVRTAPAGVLWSVSPLTGTGTGTRTGTTASLDGRGRGRECGCVVRVAGTTTDGVREWLKEQLVPLEAVIGKDAYARAFV
jgi:urease accessory protein